MEVVAEEANLAIDEERRSMRRFADVVPKSDGWYGHWEMKNWSRGCRNACRHILNDI